MYKLVSEALDFVSRLPQLIHAKTSVLSAENETQCEVQGEVPSFSCDSKKCCMILLCYRHVVLRAFILN